MRIVNINNTPKGVVVWAQEKIGTRYGSSEGVKGLDHQEILPLCGSIIEIGRNYALTQYRNVTHYLFFSSTPYFVDSTSCSFITTVPSAYWITSVSIIKGHTCLVRPIIGAPANASAKFSNAITCFSVRVTQSKYRSYCSISFRGPEPPSNPRTNRRYTLQAPGKIFYLVLSLGKGVSLIYFIGSTAGERFQGSVVRLRQLQFRRKN